MPNLFTACKAVALGALCLSARALAAPAKLSFFETVGCEYEVFSNNATRLDGILRSANLTTLPPHQLSPVAAARLSMGWPVTLPGKGQDHGKWRVVPELAFPLDSHELVSPALPYSRTDEVVRVGEALAAHGERTTGDGAFHVHVGHDALSVQQVIDVVRLWQRHEPMLYALANTNLRQRQLYARPLEPAFVEALERQPPGTKSALHALYVRTHQPLTATSLGAHAQRFYGLNLHYVGRGHTLEFRPYQFAAGFNGSEAQAFIDLSLAVVAAGREGRVPALLQQRFDPQNPADAERFLDALGLDASQFATSRQHLLAHLRCPHGFAWLAGERGGLIMEAVRAGVAVGLAYATHTWQRAPAWLRRTSAVAAESLTLAAILHGAAGVAEQHGVGTAVTTYAAREWSVGQFALIGCTWRALDAVSRRRRRTVA